MSDIALSTKSSLGNQEVTTVEFGRRDHASNRASHVVERERDGGLFELDVMSTLPR